MWFTLNHTHDAGAVKASFKYFIPFSYYIWGNEKNALVNLDNPTADERGIIAVIVDPGEYQGT